MLQAAPWLVEDVNPLRLAVQYVETKRVVALLEHLDGMDGLAEPATDLVFLDAKRVALPQVLRLVGLLSRAAR